MLDNAEKIHQLSMQIMEKTGMLFHHPDAVSILKEHGIRMEGHVAYFTAAAGAIRPRRRARPRSQTRPGKRDRPWRRTM